ncbi:MAG: S41 family peptidase [Firmicutes bacterium]|nr:S41 family peptidase [Bacillota bacterium]
MKNTIIIFIFALVFGACNFEAELDLDNNNFIEPIFETEVEQVSQRQTMQQFLESASDGWFNAENLIYDIDFLIQTLDENFPFIGVAERITGNNGALNILESNLSRNVDSLSRNDFALTINSVFFNVFSNLAHLDVNPLYHSTLDFSGLSSSHSLFNFNRPIFQSPTIIEKDKVALIPMCPTFFNNTEVPLREMMQLQEFIAKIQGYEHVIIDLRHIRGGWFGIAVDTFIRPNLSENLFFQEFAFIKNGEIAMATYEEYLRTARTIGRSTFSDSLRAVTNEPLVPATQFAENHNLTNMNLEDLSNLDYGFIVEILLEPTNHSSRLPFLAENIWLLIGPNNFSAATIFANVAKESGFTLVGQQTSNRNSCGRAFFQLPNTGHTISMDTFYITDSTGRNIEEFPTEPHYFNRPGMDALETVLAIIEEME